MKQQWCPCQGSKGDGGAAFLQVTGSGSHDLKLEFQVLPYCVPEDVEHQRVYPCCERTHD